MPNDSQFSEETWNELLNLRRSFILIIWPTEEAG